MAKLSMKQTGEKISELLKENEITVSDLQQMLGLACPQSIYKWIRGESYPAITHLYQMSILFSVPMEKILGVEVNNTEYEGDKKLNKNGFNLYQRIDNNVKKNQINALIDQLIDLLRIKNALDSDKELEAQISILKLKLEIFGISIDDSLIQ